MATVEAMFCETQDKIAIPLSELSVDDMHEFLDIQKPILAPIECDTRDAKKRISVAKPKTSKKTPQAAPAEGEAASSASELDEKSGDD